MDVHVRSVARSLIDWRTRSSPLGGAVTRLGDHPPEPDSTRSRPLRFLPHPLEIHLNSATDPDSGIAFCVPAAFEVSLFHRERFLRVPRDRAVRGGGGGGRDGRVVVCERGEVGAQRRRGTEQGQSPVHCARGGGGASISTRVCGWKGREHATGLSDLGVVCSGGEESVAELRSVQSAEVGGPGAVGASDEGETAPEGAVQ